ncbi:hypothetical protein PHYBOEH_008432 [Phytophthora boehmeriae]|uniref:Vesicle tethering protein Uso1/P115-like head domain-containing protein n=1 Tax=Phytophthora boehmeriae TaxID=109152 RepID=A0A8T1W4Y2_9STRA|nr:hypothetical protein PHYBOEH_008432 [Phytophthora boehmeriae]
MQALLSRIVVPSDDSSSSASANVSSRPSTPSSSVPRSPAASNEPQSPSDQSVTREVQSEISLAVERLQFATLLSERKRAVQALQDLLHQFKPTPILSGPVQDATAQEIALGDASVPVVLAALVSDPRDTELMEAMLELLQSLVTRAPSAALLLLEQPQNAATCWGMQTCLTLLQDPSPWIRGPAIALVRTLQEAQPKSFAHAVLECKEGLRRLLEVVEDKREHIRDAALAVLGQLTGRDKNAQQFLAFEEGFTRLFQIIEVEGLTENGASPASTVTADCLQIVNNMVRDNLMTQTLFLEMAYLETHVPRLLRLPGIDGVDEQDDAAALNRRKRVLKLGLQLVRFLVAGLYEGVRETSLDELAQRDRARKSQDLNRIQSLVARQEALMGAVGELVCCRSDDLTDLRLQALDLLRLVSEHNGGVQMILVNLYAWPSGRNVLAELVNVDVGNESDDSPVAAAASALLDALFDENEGACMAVLQHIQSPPPPPSAESGGDAVSVPPSAGRVLLDAFIYNIDFIDQRSDSSDTETLNSKLVLAWKASHRLSSLLSDSSYCKELALRVPSEYGDSEARAVAGGLFLSRCLRLLKSSNDVVGAAVQSIVFQAKLSVLFLLIRWCHGCPKAVREVVGSVTNLSVLVDILSDKQIASSSRSSHEETQLRGLVALLLGCCLEFLCEDDEQQALKMANTKPIMAEEEGLRMTREQLLDMISKRLGLERFTDALVQFQQTPAVLACARASVTQSSRIILAYRASYDQDESAEGGNAEAHYLFMLYERSFTAFYREMAERIQKRIIAIYTGVDQGAPTSGVDSGAHSAVSAYQDLIRVQDKQIHDLQRQVDELKQREKDSGEVVKETLSNDDNRLHTHVNEQLSAQRDQFESEKRELQSKIKSLTDSAAEMENRMSGLTMAYEQLEREHQQQGLELAATRTNDSRTSGEEYHLTISSGVDDQLAALQAELDAALETNRRLRSEASSTNGDSVSQALRDKSDAELSNARLVKQLEEMRVESGRKDEQLAECEQMLETLTAGQTLMKSENEKLKAQLADAASLSGQELSGQGNELVGAVASLKDDKAQLERRLEELEAAARDAYEKDQEVLRQRVQEVEQAREAACPTRTDCSDAATQLPSSDGPEQVNTEETHLKEMVSSQLNELKELRALVVEMEAVAKEREAQASQAAFLQELVAGYDVQTRRDKEKFDATIRELEGELARAFLEKKDAGRKAKAAVKELENEVARLFLAKVELEKELSAVQQGEDRSQAANGEAVAVNGSRRSVECEASNDSSLDDLLVLVASLEIQCSVLRESLKDAQGEHAVAVAVELSRQRGAVVSV